MRRAAALLLAALCLAPVAARAVSPAPNAAPEAVWTLKPGEPKVGDRITARLTVTLPPGARMDWTAVGPRFDPLVPEGATALPAVTGPGGTAEGRAWTLYIDLPGSYRLPGVTVPWWADDGTPGTLTAAAVEFAVEGAFDRKGPVPDPAPAKPPVGLPLPAWVPAALGGAVLAVAVLGLLAYRRLRDRPVAAPPAADTPPHEAALARLAGLDPDRLPPRDFYGRLSDVTRVYLEARWDLPATRRTTSEMWGLLDRLDGTNQTDRPAGAPVAEWLAAFDLVKFAQVEPTREEARAHLEAVRRWVASTAREV